MNKEPRPFLLCVVGSTAVGKTAVSVALARTFSGEIVSCDSRQIYRRMDIGTAKPTPEEQAAAPHHMLDVASPDENYSAARYQQEADAVIKDIISRNKLPIVTGGTGLYLWALVHGLHGAQPDDAGAARAQWQQFLENFGENALLSALARVDPDTAARLSPRDHVRVLRALEVYTTTGATLSERLRAHKEQPPRYDTFTLGLERDRAELYRRIEDRVDEMVARGFLEETRALLASGVSADAASMRAIGYRQMAQVAAGARLLPDAVRDIKQATRRYAKRQRTWFVHQWDAHWLMASDGNLSAASTEIVEKNMPRAIC